MGVAWGYSGRMTEKPPWPYWTAKAAAKRLGVGIELVQGLAQSNQIRSQERRGRSGERVWVVNRDDVLALEAKMASVTGRR